MDAAVGAAGARRVRRVRGVLGVLGMQCAASCAANIARRAVLRVRLARVGRVACVRYSWCARLAAGALGTRLALAVRAVYFSNSRRTNDISYTLT